MSVHVDSAMAMLREQAARFGVAIKEVVWRTNWTNDGPVLDVYIGPAEVEPRFGFWDAVSMRTNLTVMVHVKREHAA